MEKMVTIAFKNSAYEQEMVQQANLVKALITFNEDSSKDGEKSTLEPEYSSQEKHLWRIYGRLILDYGIIHSKGDDQQQIIKLATS